MSLKENFTIGVLESGFKQGLLIACASYLACSHSPSPTSFLSLLFFFFALMWENSNPQLF